MTLIVPATHIYIKTFVYIEGIFRTFAKSGKSPHSYICYTHSSSIHPDHYMCVAYIGTGWFPHFANMNQYKLWHFCVWERERAIRKGKRSETPKQIPSWQLQKNHMTICFQCSQYSRSLYLTFKKSRDTWNMFAISTSPSHCCGLKQWFEKGVK